MSSDLDPALDQIMVTIRSVFHAKDQDWLNKVANYEVTIQNLQAENMNLKKSRDEISGYEEQVHRLQNENTSLRKMYDEVTEKYSRVKRALDKLLRRRKSEPAADIDQIASVFMESTSTFEDAATAALLARSNTKRPKTDIAIPDRPKQLNGQPKGTPFVNRISSTVLNHDIESKATEPSLSPQLGDYRGICSASSKDHPTTSCDTRAVKPETVADIPTMMKSIPMRPERNLFKGKDQLQLSKISNEFNTTRCGVAASELQGHDCSQCGDFYKHIGIERAPSNYNKSLIDSVSRHRSTRKRPETPQGFWNIGFPATQNSL